MVGFDLAWVLSGLLLIPYLLWGFYLLRERLVHRVELDRAVETFTVTALFFFFIFEFTLLKKWLGHNHLKLVFSVLGLTVSAAALYGPLLVSFISHFIVDLIMPTRRYGVSVPQYGTAEACELRGDFEGAAREFVAVSRMFPKETKAAIRAADNYMKVDRPADAVPWFELALKSSASPEETLSIANRLHDIYLRKLDNRDAARKALETYLARFPDSEFAGSVSQRLARLDTGSTPVPRNPFGENHT